jgi:hypothetical protein
LVIYDPKINKFEEGRDDFHTFRLEFLGKGLDIGHEEAFYLNRILSFLEDV